MFKIATLILLSATVINGQLVGTEKCSAEEARAFADWSMVPALLSRNFSIPNDLESATEYCEQSKLAIKNMRTYSKKCLSDFTRHATSMMVYGFNQAVRKQCKTEALRRGNFN